MTTLAAEYDLIIPATPPWVMIAAFAAGGVVAVVVIVIALIRSRRGSEREPRRPG